MAKLKFKTIIFIILASVTFTSNVLYGANKTVLNNTLNTTIAIDKQILNMENLLKERKAGKLNEEIAKLKSLKKSSSIFYIPEINYLLQTPIETIPSSSIEIKRKKIESTDILLGCASTLLIILSFYTLIYLSDKIFSKEASRNLGILIGSITLISSFVFKFPIFLALAGIMAGINLGIRKKRIFGVGLITTILLLLTAQSFQTYLFSRITNKEALLTSKTERDNYAPDFMIENISDKRLKDAVKLANRQALLASVNINDYEEINKNTANPKIKALCLNNIGCILFSQNKTKDAISYFNKAEKIYATPKTLFNLFISYSSALDMEKAAEYQKKFKKTGDFYEKEAPIVMHFGDITSKEFFKIESLLKNETFYIVIFGIILGIFIGIKTKSSSMLLAANPILGKFPGYKLYHNNRYASLIIFLTIVALVEILWRYGYGG